MLISGKIKLSIRLAGVTPDNARGFDEKMCSVTLFFQFCCCKPLHGHVKAYNNKTEKNKVTEQRKGNSEERNRMRQEREEQGKLKTRGGHKKRRLNTRGDKVNACPAQMQRSTMSDNQQGILIVVKVKRGWVLKALTTDLPRISE